MDDMSLNIYRYIAPEHVPIQYGGLSKEGECEFTTADPVTEVTVKPACKHTVEIPVSESGVLVWELRVVAWDVSYEAEFVPRTEDGYTIILQKTRKVAPTDEPVISNSYKIGEAGKVVIIKDGVFELLRRKRMCEELKLYRIDEPSCRLGQKRRKDRIFGLGFGPVMKKKKKANRFKRK